VAHVKVLRNGLQQSKPFNISPDDAPPLATPVSAKFSWPTDIFSSDNHLGLFRVNPATTTWTSTPLWFLLNGAYHSNQFISLVESSVPSAATVALVSAALAHNSFVPAPGQVVGVLADGGDGLQNNGSDVQSLLIEVPVPPVATGCPATQGFWHKADHWPNSNNAIDGVIYTGATKSITIGGITYTQGQLLALLPSRSLHTGGYVNALTQFIATVLNLVSGAQHAGIDATVSTINTDLTGVTFVSGSGTALDPYVLAPISAGLQATLSGFESTLDSSNSAAGLGCTEASGLNLGH
jgi:hypothetical protein